MQAVETSVAAKDAGGNPYLRKLIGLKLTEAGGLLGEGMLAKIAAKSLGVPLEVVAREIRQMVTYGQLCARENGRGRTIYALGTPPGTLLRKPTPDTPPETTPVEASGVPQDGAVGVAAISTPPEQERGRDGQGVTFERLSEKEADEEILTQWGARASKIVPATLAHQNIPVGTIEDGALKDGRLAAPPGQGNAKSGLLPVPPRRWDTEVKLTPTGPRALTYLELTPSERFKIQFLKLVEEQGIEASEAVAPIGLPWAAPGPLLYRVGVALGLLDGSLVTKKEATS